MTHPWRLARCSLALDEPRLIGILNVTPDSFSDGGAALTPAIAAEKARRLVEEGASMIDVGGESTRPGAARVEADEQIRRIIPAIRAIRDAGVTAPISIDTTLARVAEAAMDAGAEAINDVSAATEDPRMLPLAAERAAGLILMHRRAAPPDDRYSNAYVQEPEYGPEGLVNVVRAFLLQRADAALRVGVHEDAIVLDPGLGFGKSVEQNFDLARNFPVFAALGWHVLSAASRKSFIGAAGGVTTPSERVAGSVALSVVHALAGVRLFRVHDVRAHAEALRVAGRLLPPSTAPRGTE